MNPHQQNKVDFSVRVLPLLVVCQLPLTFIRFELSQSLSPDEQRLLRLYGKLPTKKDLLQNKLKVRWLLAPCGFFPSCSI